MKVLKIVRSDSGKDCVRFFEIDDNCSATEFYTALQNVFGNASTLLYAPVLCDSHGNKMNFKRLDGSMTYFLTFEKKDATNRIEIGTRDGIISLNSTNLKVFLPDEYLLKKIKGLQEKAKLKLGDLAIRQEHNMAILNQSLNKVHTVLGSQSLRLIEYGSGIGNIISKMDYLGPHLKNFAGQLREISQELRMVYAYKPPPGLEPRVPRNFRNYNSTDPLHQSYIKKPFNIVLKDLPMNELGPNELKRFLKFNSMLIQEDESQAPSQNTPRKQQIVQQSSRPKKETISRAEAIKVMIHKEWSMGMGYIKIVGNMLKVARTPSFENCESYDLTQIISIDKAIDISHMAIELTFKAESFSLEFMDGDAFNYWYRLLKM